MSITAERLKVEVEAETKRARDELGRFTKSTEQTAKSADRTGTKATGMGRKFSVAGARVKAVTGGMVAAMAGKTIMAASGLNEVLSKTGVVFGPQADRVKAAAQQMADKFGISKTTFLDAASGIGLVGKASGLTKKAAAGLSTNFAKLAADASSFYDVPVEEALAAMKSGLVGEAEPMRRFGVLLSEAAVKSEAVRLGLAKTGDELTEQQKVQARSSLIMKGMADASGDLERTQGSVANRIRELKGRIGNFAADMGSKALPAAEKFLAALMDLPGVISRVVTWGKEFVNGFLSPFRPLIDPIAQALKDAAGGAGDFADKLRPLAGFIERNGEALGKVAGIITAVFIPAMVASASAAVAAKVRIVAAWVAQQAAAAKNAAMVGVTMARTVAAWTMAAGAAAAQGARIVAAWVAQQAAAAKAAAAQVAALARMAAAHVAQGARMAAAAAATAARVVAGWVLMGAQALLQAARMAAAWVIAMGPVGWAIAAAIAVAVAVVKNWDKIKAVTVKVFSAVGKFVSKVWAGIQSGVSAAVNAVKSFIQAGFNAAAAIVRTYVTIWKAVITGAWRAILAVIRGAVNLVKAYIRGWAFIAGFIGGLFQKARALAVAALNALLGFIRGLPAKIKGVFAGAASWLWNAGVNIIQGLWDGIQSMFGKVQDLLGGLTDLIPDWKGPYRKDLKLLRKNGRAIMQGLVKGFKQEFPKVRRYLNGITDWVREGFGGPLKRRLVQRIRKSQEAARAAWKREQNITDRLKRNLARRDDLKEAKGNLRDSMRNGITAQANVLNAGNNAGTIRASLDAQLVKAREFVKNLQTMRRMGFAREVIDQVASAGIEQGAEVAKALTQAGQADVKGINRSFKGITRLAGDQAKRLSNQLYDGGIQAANGLIQGLRSRQKAVEAQMVKLAQGLKKALKRALEIRSPSRFTDRLGQMWAEGLIRGQRRRRHGVARASLELAQGARNAITGNLGPGGPPRPPGGPGGITTAAVSGGAGSGGQVSLEFHTYNPVAEPQSRTTNKALDRVANLSLV